MRSECYRALFPRGHPRKKSLDLCLRVPARSHKGEHRLTLRPALDVAHARVSSFSPNFYASVEFLCKFGKSLPPIRTYYGIISFAKHRYHRSRLGRRITDGKRLTLVERKSVPVRFTAALYSRVLPLISEHSATIPLGRKIVPWRNEGSFPLPRRLCRLY